MLKYSDNIKDASHIISRLIFIASNKIQLLQPIMNIILISSLKKQVRFTVMYILRRGWQTYGMHTQCHANSPPPKFTIFAVPTFFPPSPTSHLPTFLCYEEYTHTHTQSYIYIYSLSFVFFGPSWHEPSVPSFLGDCSLTCHHRQVEILRS